MSGTVFFLPSEAWGLARVSPAFRFWFPVDLEVIHRGTGVISLELFPTVQGKITLALNSLAFLPLEKRFLGFSPGRFWSVDGRFFDLLDVENILFPARS